MGAQLAADTTRVRSLVLSAMLYKDLLIPFLTSDGWAAFLDSWPNGYWDRTAADYEGIVSRISDEAVRQFVFETQAGLYPTGNFWDLFNGPPYFDPGVARAPGLVIGGAGDTVAGAQDPFDVAADYGTADVRVVILENGGHVPRLTEPEIVDAFWRTVFEFIDP